MVAVFVMVGCFVPEIFWRGSVSFGVWRGRDRDKKKKDEFNLPERYSIEHVIGTLFRVFQCP